MMSHDGYTEQDLASIEGPRGLKEKGSPAWCWQTVSALQTMWKALDLDLDIYLTTWTDAEQFAIWEKIPYDNPYGTKDAMLADLELGDDARARARVASQALVLPPLVRHGGNRVSEQPVAQQVAQKYGKTNADYLTRRIARDHPEVHERMKLGEFTSVAAAAREAGIYPDKPRAKQVTVNGDLKKVARRLREILGDEEYSRFLDIAANLEE